MFIDYLFYYSCRIPSPYSILPVFRQFSYCFHCSSNPFWVQTYCLLDGGCQTFCASNQFLFDCRYHRKGEAAEYKLALRSWGCWLQEIARLYRQLILKNKWSEWVVRYLSLKAYNRFILYLAAVLKVIWQREIGPVFNLTLIW